MSVKQVLSDLEKPPTKQHLARIEHRKLLPHVHENLPKAQRLQDEELLRIGLEVKIPKDRWLQAPYTWSWTGKLYNDYFYLAMKQDEKGNKIWPPEVLKKFLHNSDPDRFYKNQERPDFYTSKRNDIGGVRIRRLPALRPNRSEAGRFEKAMESREGRELMKASYTTEP